MVFNHTYQKGVKVESTFYSFCLLNVCNLYSINLLHCNDENKYECFSVASFNSNFLTKMNKYGGNVDIKVFYFQQKVIITE